MRQVKEMMGLILKVANDDNRIRAVYMNGSRTNKNAKVDIFQDFDIVYVVKETASFIEDKDWIDVFGERLFMQLPEEMDKVAGHAIDFNNCYGYLIQFADGNRLDLHLQSLELSSKEVLDDKLTIILLDKDNALPEIPSATDEDYRVKKPTEALFLRCCNEFYWLIDNVSKGLWRGEVTYVLDNINYWMRPQLEKMLSWYAGMITDFKYSMGKSIKYINQFIPNEYYKRYLNTFSTAEIDSIWASVHIMCDLFKELALKVSAEFNFTFNSTESENAIYFLNHVEHLPNDATDIF